MSESTTESEALQFAETVISADSLRAAKVNYCSFVQIKVTPEEVSLVLGTRLDHLSYLDGDKVKIPTEAFAVAVFHPDHARRLLEALTTSLQNYDTAVTHIKAINALK